MPDVSAPDAGLDADLALISEVAREAGALSLHWLKKGARRWDKSPNNPVTEADIACNDLIAKRLRPARPDYGWLSEETRDNAQDRSQKRVFVIDEAVERIKNGTITQYIYDPQAGRLVKSAPAAVACAALFDDITTGEYVEFLTLPGYERITRDLRMPVTA